MLTVLRVDERVRAYRTRVRGAVKELSQGGRFRRASRPARAFCAVGRARGGGSSTFQPPFPVTELRSFSPFYASRAIEATPRSCSGATRRFKPPGCWQERKRVEVSSLSLGFPLMLAVSSVVPGSLEHRARAASERAWRTCRHPGGHVQARGEEVEAEIICQTVRRGRPAGR